MIRLACALQLVVIALTLAMLRDTASSTAIPLVFIGLPCLGLGLALALGALFRLRRRRSPVAASLEE